MLHLSGIGVRVDRFGDNLVSGALVGATARPVRCHDTNDDGKE